MTFALQQSDIPTLPIAPAQICNPLNHEWINVPIDEARPIRPMDVIILATPAITENPSVSSVPSVVERYRVMVLTVTVQRIGRPEQPTLSPEQRSELLHSRLDQLCSKTFINVPNEPSEPSASSVVDSYVYRLLCEPIEDECPSLLYRDRWLVGDHGQWLSITIRDSPRIYCVKRENLFGERKFTEEIQCRTQNQKCYQNSKSNYSNDSRRTRVFTT